MRKLNLLLSVLVAAGMLAACKGDRTLTTFVTSPDAGSAAGYVGGTPITLIDGTPVTLVDGTPVTSPKLSNKKNSSSDSNNQTDTNGDGEIDQSDVASPVGGNTNSGGNGTTVTTLPTTGTTSVTAKPNVNRLQIPKTGVYTFRESLVQDDGGSGYEDDVLYRYAGDGQKTVRIQRSDASGTVLAEDYYAETYDTDGLYLVDSALYGDPCAWSPKAASLPQSVIDGGKVTTKSSCSTTINNQPATFELEVTIGFKRLKTIVFDGKDYLAIDVSRHRVLTHGNETITSDAIDTYAFALGIRVATSDHSISEDGKRVRASTRNLVLVKLPK